MQRSHSGGTPSVVTLWERCGVEGQTAVAPGLLSVSRSIPESEICPDARLHWAESKVASARKQGGIRPNVTHAKACKNGEMPCSNGGTRYSAGARH